MSNASHRAAPVSTGRKLIGAVGGKQNTGAKERRLQRLKNKSVAARAKIDPLEAADEPGRNDPCPCGSGEKFKRCCS